MQDPCHHVADQSKRFGLHQDHALAMCCSSQAVKEGSIAFKRAHGCDVYQYGEMPEHPEFASEFCDAMTFFTRHSLQGGSRGLEVGSSKAGPCVYDICFGAHILYQC